MINFTDDAGTKDALQFLITREITSRRSLRLSRAWASPAACGRIEEGEEVIAEGEGEDPASADLALIAAA